MKKLLLFTLSLLTSFSFITVKAESRPMVEGFYRNGEQVEAHFYDYGGIEPLYDVNDYSVTCRVYLDKWYNLGSTKTWNSVQSYNGKYEITINNMGIVPNRTSDLYIAVSVNKGTFTDATFDFYNLNGELDTTAETSSLNLANGTYFIWSEKFKSVNALTKCIVTINYTTGTGSHTTEVTGINVYEYPEDDVPTEPDTPSDSTILDWLNDTWTDVMAGLNGTINYIYSFLRNVMSPQLETIITLLENGLGISTDVDTSTNDSKNEELSGAVNQYDSIEQTLVSDFNTNINNLNTDLNILGVTDFVKTSSFVSTQLQTIYNSNEYLQYVVVFGLVIGIAMTIIGIRSRR